MPVPFVTDPIVDPTAMLEFAVEVGPVQDLGVVDGGRRRFLPITGGTVRGIVAGTILAGGGDWQRIAPDGTIEIDARYVLAIDDAKVEVHSSGLRTGPTDVLARLGAGEPVSASDYYFRTALRFSTGDAALSWLNRVLAVGIGAKCATGVELRIYRVL